MSFKPLGFDKSRNYVCVIKNSQWHKIKSLESGLRCFCQHCCHAAFSMDAGCSELKASRSTLDSRYFFYLELIFHHYAFYGCQIFHDYHVYLPKSIWVVTTVKILWTQQSAIISHCLEKSRSKRSGVEEDFLHCTWLPSMAYSHGERDCLVSSFYMGTNLITRVHSHDFV